MIFKLQTAHAPQPAWLYLDGIAKVQDYGQLMVPLDDPAAWPSVRGEVIGRDDEGPDEYALGVFRTHTDLTRAVDRMWGPASVRQFADELWPKFHRTSEASTVTCLRLERRDGSCILALLNDNAFLMSDEGHTVERLR